MKVLGSVTLCTLNAVVLEVQVIVPQSTIAPVLEVQTMGSSETIKMDLKGR
jgi:hypothetical protein